METSTKQTPFSQDFKIDLERTLHFSECEYKLMRQCKETVPEFLALC